MPSYPYSFPIHCQRKGSKLSSEGAVLEQREERIQFRQGRPLRRLQPLHCVYLQANSCWRGSGGDWNNKLLDDLHVKSRHDSTTLSNTEPMQDMRMQEKARMEVGRQALSMVERDAAKMLCVDRCWNVVRYDRTASAGSP